MWKSWSLAFARSRFPSSRTMRIISGGQSGVDRAALFFALAHGFDHGGWVPTGRPAEDGQIPDDFDMWELTEFDCFEHGYNPADMRDQYRLRTRLNIQDSDYTLVFRGIQNSGGTNLTIDLCQQLRKPHQVVAPGALPDPLPSGVETLNVAGPRLSRWSEGPEAVERGLTALLVL